MASAAGTSWGITVITGLCSKAQPVVAVLKRKKRSGVKMNVKGKGGSKRHNYGPAPLAGYQLVGCWCATHSGGALVAPIFFQPDYRLVPSLSHFHLLKIEYFSEVKIGFHQKLLK